MKVKAGQLFNGYQMLANLAEQDLPIKVAFKLARLLPVISAEFNTIEDIRTKLVAKHGEHINPEEAGPMRVPQENVVAFMADFNEILIEDVEINWEPISMNLMGDSVSMSVKDVLTVGFIFTEYADIDFNPQSMLDSMLSEHIEKQEA